MGHLAIWEKDFDNKKDKGIRTCCLMKRKVTERWETY